MSLRPIIHHAGMLKTLLLGGVLIVTCNTALSQDAWPTISLPKEVQSFAVGKEVTVNGLPMRMRGFISTIPPDQLADWFRRSLGKPLVENRLANQLILGRNEGDYYLTVQIEPAKNGTRGIASVTHLKTAYENQEATKESTARWLSRLPAGSQLLSQMVSEDAGNLSTHLLYLNTHSEELNAEYLKRLLRSEGFELAQHANTNDKLISATQDTVRKGISLIFKGSGKEAVATIHQEKNGQTAVVLNMVTQVERFK